MQGAYIHDFIGCRRISHVCWLCIHTSAASMSVNTANQTIGSLPYEMSLQSTINRSIMTDWGWVRGANPCLHCISNGAVQTELVQYPIKWSFCSRVKKTSWVILICIYITYLIIIRLKKFQNSELVCYWCSMLMEESHT